MSILDGKLGQHLTTHKPPIELQDSSREQNVSKCDDNTCSLIHINEIYFIWPATTVKAKNASFHFIPVHFCKFRSSLRKCFFLYVETSLDMSCCVMLQKG